jgi:hypothetical protein
MTDQDKVRRVENETAPGSQRTRSGAENLLQRKTLETETVENLCFDRMKK